MNAEVQKRTFARTELATAIAGALFALSMAGVASAQQAADDNKPETKGPDGKPVQKVETTTVVGIRKGIEDAISVKKNSTSIVESVSAEDIGKLPDNSIAESIARLPGLAAQRVGGRAQTVSIRGMSGDFAGTLLNGREQVSTGDNRAVEFDQFPSELLSGVTIYKTPDASLIGQGLSGTIDMQTVRPLNFSSRQVAVNLRGQNNSLGKLNADSKTNGYRLSASYIDQFANRTFGLALGYARLDSPSQTQRWEAWGYTGANPAVAGPNAGAVGGGKVFADSTESVRDGFMAVAEWRPSKDLTSVLDLYYSKFDTKTVARGLEGGFDWGGATLIGTGLVTTPITGASGQNANLVTTGTWTGYKPVIRNDLNRRSDDVLAIGWNTKMRLAGGWSLTGDLSYSRAKKNESIAETYGGTVTQRDTVTFNQNLGSFPTFRTGLNYADTNVVRLVDSGGWNQDGYIKYLNVKDEMKALRFDVSKSMEGWFSAINFGLAYNNRTKTKDVPEYFLDLKVRPGATNQAVPASLLNAPTNLSFAGIPTLLSYNIEGALGSVYNQRANLNNGDINQKNWTVDEKITTGYVKLDIDQDLGSVPVRGNVGVQVVNTDQSSSAFAFDGARYTPVTDGKKYTDILPSANLIFQLPSDQVVRLGVAKTLTRARLDQLRAAFGYGVNNTQTPTVWTGGGGNPKLDPFRATSFDVSYEKYFGTRAYIGVAGFYKDLKSYIYDDKALVDVSRFPTPTGSTRPPTNLALLDVPTNGKGGNIKGIELTASLPLNLLSRALDGFGVTASYSDTNSKINVLNLNGAGTATSPMPGLSKKVGSVAAYYEKYGFSARISQRYRSKFLGEFAGFGAAREFVYIKGESVTDMQLGYTFNEGTFKNLSLLLQVNNLNNEPYRTDFVFQGYELPKQYQKYGRTILFGVNYKL